MVETVPACMASELEWSQLQADGVFPSGTVTGGDGGTPRCQTPKKRKRRERGLIIRGS